METSHCFVVYLPLCLGRALLSRAAICLDCEVGPLARWVLYCRASQNQFVSSEKALRKVAKFRLCVIASWRYDGID